MTAPTRGPGRATPRVVVVGAGVVGAAVADELVLAGWDRVTVVDQGPLPVTGGSSSHAPGLVFQTNGSRTLTRFARTTVDKLSDLGCFDGVGGLELATTPERLADLARRHGWATSWGIEAELLDPEQCADRHPLVEADRVLGGFWIPSDGLASARDAVRAQLDRAAEGGATLLGSTLVLDVRHTDGRVTGLVTDRGDLPADVVVSATGFWGPRTGSLVDLATPLLPMAHQYARTTPLPGWSPDRPEASAPILRHQDRDLYLREHHDVVGIGSYAHRPMPVDHAELPDGPMPSVLPFTPDDFAPALADARELWPTLDGVEVAGGMNGVFSFTPDGMPLLGEHPDLDGWWVAEAVWVTHSAGVGRTIARWLVDGEPDEDVGACELTRFDEVELEPSVVAARSAQGFVEVYDVVHPHDPPQVGRGLRTSPFHPRQVALGAVFDVAHGWERPLWYEANADLEDVARVPARGAWEARNWSPVAGAEALATRDRVALYDMTPLQRLEVVGPGAVDLLQRTCSNDVDRPVGSVVYALLLEPSGGVRSDVTVARLGPERYRVGVSTPVDLDRLRRAARAAGGDVVISDVTAATCGLGLWGPAARDVLAACTDDDVGDAALRFYRCRTLTVAGVEVLALRISYVGELGYELYAAAEDGLRVWDALWDAGEEHGMVAAGRRAMTSLRLEKGYRATGADLTPDHGPQASGVGFAVRPAASDFVGREAVVAGQPPTAVLAPVLLDERTRVAVGGEPVVRDGVCVGHVTSAEYGHTIGASIAYAWLDPDVAVPGTAVAVVSFDEPLPGVVHAEPLYDPEGKRMRG